MKIPFLVLPRNASVIRALGYVFGIILASIRIILAVAFAKAFFMPGRGDEWAPVLFMIDFPVGLLAFYGICFVNLTGLAATLWFPFCYAVGSLAGIYWHFLWPQLIATLADRTIKLAKPLFKAKR